jgi:Flp pilus assembly protein TadG
VKRVCNIAAHVRTATAATIGRGEAGQTMVVAVLVLTVVLGSAALAIEGGNLFLQKRNLQGNADAAARAGAAHLPSSTGQANTTASSFVTNVNAADGASVGSITFAESNTNITVNVEKQVDGSLLDLLGIAPPTVRATATAEVAMMAPSASQGMLPMAFMRGSYTPGQNAEVKFDGTFTGNRGATAPFNNPPYCVTSAGAADFRNLIISDEFGGVDACSYDVGDTLPSEPGNMSGPTRQGFSTRIGSNTQSFSDLFTYDASLDRWSVSDMSSPRVGVVPVVENLDGSTTWTGGSTTLRVTGFVLVYIGKTDSPPAYPAYTDNGRSVWVTPVRALLPSEFGEITDWYSGNGDEPTAIHLVN